MSAFERIISLLDGVHHIGDDRVIARCPAHDDQNPSLSVRRASERVLLCDHAGCTVEDICSVLGITLSDLFDNDRPFHPDPAAARERQAWANLERWRTRELRDVCDELRGLEDLADHIGRFLAAHNADLGNCGSLSEADHSFYVSGLALCYEESSALEARFELLHSKDPGHHLEAYHNAGRPRVYAA